MNMNEVFSEWMKSNDSNKEWTPEMEDSRRMHTSPYDEVSSSELWTRLSKEMRGERLKREKVFGKPQSKYHK